MDTKFAYRLDKRFIKDAEREAIVTAEKNLLQSRLLLKSKQENEEYVKEFLDPDIDRLNLYISQWQDNCVVPVKSLASEYFFLRNISNNKDASRAFKTIIHVMGRLYRYIYKVEGGWFSVIKELRKKEDKYISDNDIYEILYCLFDGEAIRNIYSTRDLKMIAHDRDMYMDFGKVELKNGKFYNWKSTPIFKSTHVAIYMNTTNKRRLPKVDTTNMYFLERYITNEKGKRESWTIYIFKYPFSIKEDFLTQHLVVDELQRKRVSTKEES